MVHGPTSAPPILACPLCRLPLPNVSACACGFKPRLVDGIVDLMTPEQLTEYGEFSAAYDRLRARQKWGGEDLDLPFGPLGHHEVWAVRRRTFKRLDRLLQNECPSKGTALDVGAGNCWLTRHLDHWGFAATALDVNDGAQDGLAAGAAFLSCGDSFERVRAPMGCLPFLDQVFDAVVASRSMQYCRDLAYTLGEFKRVLKPSGVIVVLDSPWYEREKDGVRSHEEGVRDLVERWGLDEAHARRSFFLFRDAFDDAIRRNSLEYRHIRVWPGRARAIESVKGRFFERRIASFPILMISAT